MNVFMDLNANDVLDAGEPYLATGPDGSFALHYVVAGTYRVPVAITGSAGSFRARGN